MYPAMAGGIARILFMPETNESQSPQLAQGRQSVIGYPETKDRIDVVALQRIDDEMKAVRQFGLFNRSQFWLLKGGARKNAF